MKSNLKYQALTLCFTLFIAFGQNACAFAKPKGPKLENVVEQLDFLYRVRDVNNRLYLVSLLRMYSLSMNHEEIEYIVHVEIPSLKVENIERQESLSFDDTDQQRIAKIFSKIDKVKQLAIELNTNMAVFEDFEDDEKRQKYRYLVDEDLRNIWKNINPLILELTLQKESILESAQADNKKKHRDIIEKFVLLQLSNDVRYFNQASTLKMYEWVYLPEKLTDKKAFKEGFELQYGTVYNKLDDYLKSQTNLYKQSLIVRLQADLDLTFGNALEIMELLSTPAAYEDAFTKFSTENFLESEFKRNYTDTESDIQQILVADERSLSASEVIDLISREKEKFLLKWQSVLDASPEMKQDFIDLMEIRLKNVFRPE
ncbi:MAG: hypothetical protein AAFX87_24105 [Bacteroidota bacterium]